MRRFYLFLPLLWFIFNPSYLRAQEPVIPSDLIVSRVPKPVAPVKEGEARMLSALAVGTTVPVFAIPPCEEGRHYAVFRLFYDYLPEGRTEVNWTADLTITLLNNTTVLWTKSLAVRTTDQTFESIVFHDALLSCDPNFTIRIDAKNITGAAPQGNIRFQILLHKYLEEQFTPIAPIALTPTQGVEKTILTWNNSGKGAIAYDLEWVFLANYEGTASTALAAFQMKEPVRITTAFPRYNHSTYYPNGKIFYRVRAVGYNPLYPAHRIPGSWSYGPDTGLTIANHQTDITWQAQTIFAEEGKYKKVMSYFDGTLRQRQVQTNLSTSGDTAIVGETFYDFEGRQSVDVLAVPTTSVSLKYKAAFNPLQSQHATVTPNVSAKRNKFHYDNDILTNSIVPATGGAGMYYSSANSILMDARRKDYIPNAEGYVYSMTEYLRDGTSRIRRQSGVGKEFRMDGGRPVEYFYGTPAPEELIRLFGSNVGNANHYKKNMVVDANKQTSISYFDQEGRVIATALAGTPPANVLPLPSYTSLPPGQIVVDISTRNVKQDEKSLLSQKILNTIPGTPYTFVYNFSALGSAIDFAGCVECRFDLKITITDPDGILVNINVPAIPGNTATDGSYERKGISAADCNNPTVGATISFVVNFGKQGDYTLTKTLVPAELTFEQTRALVEQIPSVQARILEIENYYAVDASNCDICTTYEQCPQQAEAAIGNAIVEAATRDCENIYQLMITDLTKRHANEPLYDPVASIQEHENYCQYALCLKDQDSEIYEKKMARVFTWTDAVNKGYDVALSNVILVSSKTDPFFRFSGVGRVSRVTMQGKLNLITIPNVMYDSNNDGIKDAPFTGPILQVTDPGNTNYYVTQGGQRSPSGKHVLYYDLMHRRSINEISEAEYQTELNKQRWIMFKMFYQESKRRTKLGMPEYNTCAPAKAELDRTDQLPMTPEGIAAWGEANGVTDGGQGVTGPVSDEELEAIVANIKFQCESEISGTESTTIATHLRNYFDGNPRNFLRLIYTSDLSANPDLQAIQTLLSSKGCSLDYLAVPGPTLTCVDTLIGGNLIINPQILKKAGAPPSCTTDITSDCYDGWDNVTGPPNTSSQHTIFLWGTRCDRDSEPIKGTLSSPLIPGKQYELCLSYKAYHDDNVYQSGRMDNVYLQFSRSNDYSLNTLELITPESPYIPFEDSVGSGNRQGAIILSECSWPPGPEYPDNIINAAGNTRDAPWRVSNITNYTSWSTYCVTFTALEASTHFFISIYHNMTQGVLLKDPVLKEVENVCLEYEDSNSPFRYTIDWSSVIAKCLTNAEAEKETLIAYAVDNLLEEEAANFYTTQRTKCLSGLTEKLTYAYEPKEYHYTLYYYDQAGNLVETVPPEGVKPLVSHTFVTRYQYNSLNQLIWQKTPDAGESRFWYNDKGQAKLSQNAQQLKDKNYSYTRYDKQGRVVEVGEMNTTVALATLATELEDIAFPSSATYALTDITKTFYDLPNTPIQATFTQEYLRDRVSWTEMHEKNAADVTATYYSYDIHGNVKSVLQQLPALGNKRTDYAYDLISGKMNYVFYQYGQQDQLIHRYKYDAENRLLEAATSADGYLFDVEAQYKYYPHGPLARVVLGQHRVQGLDYYYTLQGWVKGVNMPYAADPGNDGNAGVNFRVGRDVFSYALGFYENDYTPRNAAKVIADTRDKLWISYKAQYGSTQTGLFNGNISWMITDLKKVGQQKGARVGGMQAMMYRYDQLHRIVQSRSLTAYTAAGGFGTRTTSSPYDEDFSYDGNGNMLTLKRENALGVRADDFTYTYYNGTNKLRYYIPITRDTVYSGAIVPNNKVYRRITVQGTAFAPAGKDVTIKAIENIDIDEGFDIQNNASFRAYVLPDNEGAFNYDAIGNIIWDQDKGVKINWTPYGKVREVSKGDGTVIKFRYDAGGNRIEKKMIKPDNTTIVTRYVRDAGGQVMAVYSGKLLSEQPIYGSSRLGTYKGGSHRALRKLGTKNFELSNHLGNVLSVITDNIRMTADSTWATVVNASDYYAFGLTMPGRQSTTPATDPANHSLVLKGFVYPDNSKILTDIANNFTVELWVNPTGTHEIDTESASGTAGLTGQKFVIHPVNGGSTTVAGMGISVGTNGVSVYEQTTSYMPALLVWSGTVTGWTHLAVTYINKRPSLYINGVLVKTGVASTKALIHPSFGFMGSAQGSMTGSVDEVRIWNVVRTQAEIQASHNTIIPGNTPNLAGYWPMNEGNGTLLHDASQHGLDHAVVNYATWSAAGSSAPVTGNNAGEGNDYRYGFNGKEKDESGEFGSTTYDYGLRIYNPSIGRFLSVDPLTKEYPWNSTYAFAENDVIRSIDLEGAEKFVKTYSFSVSDGKTVVKVTDDVWTQKSDISINPTGTPDTYKQIAAHSAITYQRNPKPGNGSFAYFEFAPELGKVNYAKYTYADKSGKQQVQYFSQADMQFRFEEILTAQQNLSAAFNVAAAAANLVGAGWLMKAELKAFAGELRATTQLNTIKSHLEQFGSRAENTIMLERMEKISKGEMMPTEIDMNFAKHELRESELMKSGMSYEKAHETVLKEQNMYHKDYEKKLYTEDALKAGNAQMEKEISNKK